MKGFGESLTGPRIGVGERRPILRSRSDPEWRFSWSGLPGGLTELYRHLDDRQTWAGPIFQGLLSRSRP